MSLAAWVPWNELAFARAMLGSTANRDQRELWKRLQMDTFVARRADPDDPYECLGGES